MPVDIIKSIRTFARQEESDCVTLDLGAGYSKGVHIKDGILQSFFLEKRADNPVVKAAGWLKKKGLLSKDIHIAIKGPETLIRYITFPKVEKKKLKEAFSYEITKFIPFRREEVYFDIFVIDENHSKNEFLILLALSKRAYIDTLLKGFTDQHANIKSITLNNISLINLFLHASLDDVSAPATAKNKKENAAIIDMGTGSTLLNMVKGDLPCLSREIKLSAENLIEELSKERDISPDEAQELLVSFSFEEKPKKGDVMHEIAEEFIQALAEEIKSSLDYFEVNWGSRIQTLYLTGGLSNIPGVDGAMKKAAGIETKICDPFSESGIQCSKEASLYKKSLAVALGMTV